MWDGPTAEWWQAEVAGDPAYERDVDTLLDELLQPVGSGRVLDLGCGDGRLMERYGAIGVDSSRDLASVARRSGDVIVGDALRLPFESGSIDTAFAVLVVEHIADLADFFGEAARVVTAGGTCVVVVNHPTYTAPGSGPFMDPEDGEVLWRWGSYLSVGSSCEPAGVSSIEFHHRPFGDLVTTAAAAGWKLEVAVERALNPGDDALLAAQHHVPRLLGIRWRR